MKNKMLWGGEFVKKKITGLFVQYKALVIMAVYAVVYLAAFFLSRAAHCGST